MAGILSNTYNAIFKHKKIVFLAVFLSLLLIGVMMPSTSSAAPFVNNCGNIVTDLACNFNFYLKGLVAQAAYLVIFLDTLVSQVLGWLIGIIMNGVSYTSLDPTRNTAVALGWPIARDFANIIIVLGFIAIALATILQFKEYEAKALLGKLIVAALLVNFSLVICGLMIDVSHGFMKFFLESTNRTFDMEIREKITMLEAAVNNKNIGVGDFGFMVISTAVLGVMKAIAYGLFVILFLFRIIAIWILVILSPIAFVCYVFPHTKGVWSMWWNNFTQWLIVGIAGAFFLNIGTRLATLQLGTPPGTGIPAADFPTDLGRLFTSSLEFLIPGAFLVIGFVFSLQISAMGASYATGAARRAGGYGKASLGYAWKGTKYAGWAGADKAGITMKAQNVKNWATQKIENSGMGGVIGINKGYTSAQRQRQLQPPREAEEAAAGQPAKERQALVESGTGLGGKSTTAEWIANYERMLEKNEHKNMDEAAQRKAMDTYAGLMGKTDIYSRAGSDTAYLDTDAIEEYKRTHQKDASGKTINYDLPENADKAEYAVTKKAYAASDDADVKKMNDTDRVALFKALVAGNKGELNEKATQILELMAADGTAGKLGYEPEKLAELSNNAEEKFGANVKKSLKKSDPRQHAFDPEVTDKILTDKENERRIDAGGKAMNEEEKVIYLKNIKKDPRYQETYKQVQREAVIKATAKLDKTEYRKLDPSVFEGDLGLVVLEGSTKKQIEALMNNGPEALAKKVADRLQEEIAIIDNAIGPKTPEQSNRREKLISLEKARRVALKRIEENESRYSDDEEEDNDDTPPPGPQPTNPKPKKPTPPPTAPQSPAPSAPQPQPKGVLDDMDLENPTLKPQAPGSKNAAPLPTQQKITYKENPIEYEKTTSKLRSLPASMELLRARKKALERLIPEKEIELEKARKTAPPKGFNKNLDIEIKLDEMDRLQKQLKDTDEEIAKSENAKPAQVQQVANNPQPEKSAAEKSKEQADKDAAELRKNNPNIQN